MKSKSGDKEYEQDRKIIEIGVMMLHGDNRRNRAFLWHLKKQYGAKAVLEVLAQCEEKRLKDPYGYLVACLQRRGN